MSASPVLVVGVLRAGAVRQIVLSAKRVAQIAVHLLFHGSTRNFSTISAEALY
jgi:hypothetical protein